MSKIGNFKYNFLNWGPFVLRMKMPNYIIEKLRVKKQKFLITKV